jgi:hypothetical protein
LFDRPTLYRRTPAVPTYNPETGAEENVGLVVSVGGNVAVVRSYDNPGQPFVVVYIPLGVTRAVVDAPEEILEEWEEQIAKRTEMLQTVDYLRILYQLERGKWVRYDGGMYYVRDYRDGIAYLSRTKTGKTEKTLPYTVPLEVVPKLSEAQRNGTILRCTRCQTAKPLRCYLYSSNWYGRLFETVIGSQTSYRYPYGTCLACCAKRITGRAEGHTLNYVAQAVIADEFDGAAKAGLLDCWQEYMETEEDQKRWEAGNRFFGFSS